MILTPEQENEMMEAYYKNHWSKLITGVRVEEDTIIIKIRRGNDAARHVCSEIIKEMEMRRDPKELNV